MSQQQPQRRPEDAGQMGQDPIKYVDVFNVSGDLADKPITPGDASMMQTAENMIFGQTHKGGPAAVMQSAATVNERAGLVGHNDASDVSADPGVTVTETDIPGRCIFTESVGGQLVGQYVQAVPVPSAQVDVVAQSAITIGQALEATGQTAGDKPNDQGDAAAIQAAEVRATGTNVIVPGGLASAAQSAAAHNATVDRDDQKVKLGEVLAGATAKLTADKAVTRQDAEGVVGAEIRNNPDVATHPCGVAACMVAAARLNENVNT